MNFEYNLDMSRMIFYKYYSGNVTYNDFESSWLYIINNKLIPVNIRGILLDYRHTNIKSPIEEAYRISSFFAGNFQIFNNKKVAFVTATPEQIVLPVLIHENYPEVDSRPFSTIEAAENWING